MKLIWIALNFQSKSPERQYKLIEKIQFELLYKLDLLESLQTFEYQYDPGYNLSSRNIISQANLTTQSQVYPLNRLSKPNTLRSL